MTTATAKAPAPYLTSCTQCGPAKNAEEDGPQLDKKKSTPAQAHYDCPKCGLTHGVAPHTKGGK